jgi:hypothetical protein
MPNPELLDDQVKPVAAGELAWLVCTSRWTM